MSANLFGQRLQMMSFGESHGVAYGVVIDGFPGNVPIDTKLIQKSLDRRRPGAQSYTSARNEADQIEVLSGIFEGRSLGTPICIIVRNLDQRSQDYKTIKTKPRIGHADDTWKSKFGHADHRGGGRSSGRETLTRVIAGSLAQQLLKKVAPKLKVTVSIDQIGSHKIKCSPDQLPAKIIKLLENAKANGESYGGIASCHITGAPKNLGQPVFHKLKSDLAAAMLSLGATTGFEFGGGFESVGLKGTEFHKSMKSKNYGGIRGGISTGEDIEFRVAFKPTSSIKDTAKKGRHDPCIVPRAAPVIEAMAWFVLANHYLWSKTDQL